MKILLITLLVLSMIAVLVAFVRGIVAFLKTTEAELNSTDAGPSQSSLKQNKAMMNRILFQGLAVLILVVMIATTGRS